ncbi:PepSY domain-containing protein [Roseovarius sp. ZX-A-9]|uniref:PepSY domain-containing protein n=1 Tax=Roseovarius sp. ZX-A-9 TaxID=3014783 RepID=UPI002330351B|nr:PepSY domain-containing protein [Roseovarius sp. ZX-A-9]
MNNTLTVFALAALLPIGAALADDDDCSVPRSQWQPREAAMQVAEQNGWSVRDFEIDDGCYEIEGRDSSGREIEVKLDPATLQVIEMEYEDDDDRGGARNPAPAGTAQPPENGLFENGASPQVQVK